MRFFSFVKKIYRLIFTLFFIAILSVISFTPSAEAQNQNHVNLDRFDMLTATSGWVLLGQHLFWTSDAGQTWNEIGPSIPSDASMQAVGFVDTDTGWVLWITLNPDGSSLFHLSHTNDHGRTWAEQPLILFESGEAAAFAEKAEMGWFDTQRGWISVKQSSGSNFSIGTLFTTADGGRTWLRSKLPVADRVYFNNDQTGWAVGGPSNNQVFRTQDAGMTWQDLTPAIAHEDIHIAAFLPITSDGQALLTITTLGLQNSLMVYDLATSADSFSLVTKMLLDIQPGVISVSILDPKSFVVAIPGTASIVRLIDGQLVVLENMDGLSASIIDLDMNSLDVGWAKSIDSHCDTASSLNDQIVSATCSSITRLLHTTDGGRTWQNVNLPLVQSSPSGLRTVINDQPAIMNSISDLGNSQVLTSQGFDACEIPTLSQMQTWWDNSPYRAVNLYIGGSSRACDNVALNAAYVKQLFQQGWKFIPTWVGPQAPCTAFSSRMNSDISIAYNQGVSEANLAVERLTELGLTYPDKSSSVIYYDIEYYGTNTACRSAVNAFMNGWVSQIHSLGNLAGVYGSTLCNTGLSDFLNITDIPDVIWPARWYHNLGAGYYDPTATVWDLGSCIPNTIWSNHQRIRQYEGDHNESWGNLTLEIDSNALDGVVAVPYIYPSVKNISRLNPNPTNANTVDFAVNFSDVVTGVNLDDFKLTTSGVTSAFISAMSSSNTTYTVTVNTGSGNGTIRLDVVDDDSIKDAVNIPLGGMGLGNGNYTSGETFTITKAPTFSDVPFSHPYALYIEILYANGYTGGCSTNPLMFCPEVVMDRAQAAVFMMRGNFGSSYMPPSVPSHFFADSWANAPWGETWAEAMFTNGLTAGCLASPLKFCPDDQLTNAQAAVFGLRLKYGLAYIPPTVSGSVFADLTDVNFWGTNWAEQAYADGLIPACGTSGGKPKFCPDALVNRGFGASIIVKAKNLTMP